MCLVQGHKAVRPRTRVAYAACEELKNNHRRFSTAERLNDDTQCTVKYKSNLRTPQICFFVTNMTVFVNRYRSVIIQIFLWLAIKLLALTEQF